MTEAVTFIHHFKDGEYRKECRLMAGASMGKHSHNFDHFSELEKGTAILVVDGLPQTFNGPARLVIKAGKVHEVHAVTDIVWWCIHSTDETDPEKIDHVLIEEH